jgi:hypothetical protein
VETEVAMTNTKPGRSLADPPYTPVIGHTSRGPVFHAAGGRGGGSGIDFIVGDDDGDDPEFDDEDEEDEDLDEDDDPRGRRSKWREDQDARREQEDDDWTPPDRAAIEAMESALQRANREAMNRRRVGKVMDKFGITDAVSFEDFLRSRGIDPDTGDRSGDDDSSQDDSAADGSTADTRNRATVTKAQYEREKLRAEQRGAARAEQKYKDATTLLAADSALRAAGWVGKDINLALKLIDPDGVDVSMDGGELTVDGLEEQVAAIKDEFPSWFQPAARDRNVNRRREAAGARAIDGGNRDKAPTRKMGWADRLSRQIERGR